MKTELEKQQEQEIIALVEDKLVLFADAIKEAKETNEKNGTPNKERICVNVGEFGWHENHLIGALVQYACIMEVVITFLKHTPIGDNECGIRMRNWGNRFFPSDEPIPIPDHERDLLLNVVKIENANLHRQLFEAQYLYEDLKRDLEAIAKNQTTIK